MCSFNDTSQVNLDSFARGLAFRIARAFDKRVEDVFLLEDKS